MNLSIIQIGIIKILLVFTRISMKLIEIYPRSSIKFKIRKETKIFLKSKAQSIKTVVHS